jgi:hypothetical protein
MFRCDEASLQEGNPVLTYEVALVTDRAGSFATLLTRPVPHYIEEGRILVTTLATFEQEAEALAFLRGVRGAETQKRERTPQDLEELERHGLLPLPCDGRISDVDSRSTGG